jgi:aconitate hydratase
MRAQRIEPAAVRPQRACSDAVGPGAERDLERGRPRRRRMPSVDTFNTRRELTVGNKTYVYYSLPAAEEAGLGEMARLPRSMKVLLENLLRNEDGSSVDEDDIRKVSAFAEHRGNLEHEIAFRPARVLMQDFTGVPAVVDLAAMRDAMTKLGADPAKINPLNPVDLVIDHSVMVDEFGTPMALQQNMDREYERNLERYRFLRWGSSAFNNFAWCPPAPASAIR